MKELIVLLVVLFWAYTMARRWGRKSNAKATIQVLLCVASVIMLATSFFGAMGTLYQERKERDLNIVLRQEAPAFVLEKKYQDIKANMIVRVFPFYRETPSVTILYRELEELER